MIQSTCKTQTGDSVHGDECRFISGAAFTNMFRVWMINYSRDFLYGRLTHPCPDFNSGLTKPPLECMDA